MFNIFFWFLCKLWTIFVNFVPEKNFLGIFFYRADRNIKELPLYKKKNFHLYFLASYMFKVYFRCINGSIFSIRECNQFIVYSRMPIIWIGRDWDQSGKWKIWIIGYFKEKSYDSFFGQLLMNLFPSLGLVIVVKFYHVRYGVLRDYFINFFLIYIK